MFAARHLLLAVTTLPLLLTVPTIPVAATPLPSPTSTAGSTFTSPTEAWETLRGARRDVKAAEQRVTDMDAIVTAAEQAVTEAEQAVTDAEQAMADADAAKRASDVNVSRIAHKMYLSGGAGTGEMWELFALPAGMDIQEAVHTQAYLHASSNYLLRQAQQAAAFLTQQQNDLADASLALQAAQDSLTAAKEEAAEASSDVVAARDALAATRASFDSYLASLPTVPVVADCTSPSSDNIAATIYAQAQGLGLGDVAALIGIGVGLGETGLQNDTEGDCWSGNCNNGHTSSRGVFQQFYSWTPPGMAWSGQDAPTGGPGTPYDQFNATNAWGPDGWAQRDPRMSPAQAANMFFLGPNYAAGRGLEDNPTFQALQGTDPLDLTPDQMVTVAHEVQQFPEKHKASYQNNMLRAFDYYLRIKSGAIPTPAFQPPVEGMYRNATTNTTRTALQGVTPTKPAAPLSDDTTAIPRDGLLLIGDSLAEGVATLTPLPGYLYGGPVVARHKVGIRTEAAITKWRDDIKTGPHRIVVSLGSNDSPTSAAAYSEQIDRFMQAAGKDRHVFWYTLHYRPVEALNSVLVAKARQYDNLTLIETRTFLTADSPYLSERDNYLHPTADGYEQMWNAAINTEQQLSGYCPVWN